MKANGNTILITGGSTGIGLALAIRLQKAGNEVIICGRNQEKLDAAVKDHPELHPIQSDVSTESERVKLFETVTRDFPNTNVLINNAGIMRSIKLDTALPWSQTSMELNTNLNAPIHLSQLFVEHLMKQDSPAIMFTTSGLAHITLASTPIYSATKAALHSFTLALRHQLRDTKVEVIEICPPQVQTDLQGPNVPKGGADLDEYADAVMADLNKGELEITYGFSKLAAQASRAEKDEMFTKLNAMR